jgi:hypothetical protein
MGMAVIGEPKLQWNAVWQQFFGSANSNHPNGMGVTMGVTIKEDSSNTSIGAA